MGPHTQPGNRPALEEPLSDAEYDRLAAILDDLPGEDAMDLEEMDGFFAALICGPVTIPPSVYLDEIWGEQDGPFDTIDGLEEFLNLALRHWNSIARTLATPDEIFVPWLITEQGENIPRGNLWALGFLRGVHLCRNDWNEIFEDEDKFAMLMPMMTLAHENDPDEEMRPWNTPPNSELRQEVLVGLSVAAQKLHHYFLPHRKREAASRNRGTAAVSRKIGRNDPCYCGSGKKYKRCCGNVAVQ